MVETKQKFFVLVGLLSASALRSIPILFNLILKNRYVTSLFTGLTHWGSYPPVGDVVSFGKASFGIAERSRDHIEMAGCLVSPDTLQCLLGSTEPLCGAGAATDEIGGGIVSHPACAADRSIRSNPDGILSTPRCGPFLRTLLNDVVWCPEHCKHHTCQKRASKWCIAFPSWE
jgi:hypothetical protein